MERGLTITGVGSRRTPKSLQGEMTKIGDWVRERNYWIRSGHAEGADWAFEQGAQERCVAYVPWKNFNQGLESSAVKIVFETLPQEVQRRALDTILYHPNSQNLSASVRKIMARNAMQVLGTFLRTPSDAVVFWTLGELQAVRIATAYEVPLINMAFSDFSSAEQVIAELEKLKEQRDGSK